MLAAAAVAVGFLVFVGIGIFTVGRNFSLRLHCTLEDVEQEELVIDPEPIAGLPTHGDHTDANGDCKPLPLLLAEPGISPLTNILEQRDGGVERNMVLLLLLLEELLYFGGAPILPPPPYGVLGLL